MIVNNLSPPVADLMHAWRRQIGHRHTLAAERGPRTFAVISYLIHGPLAEDRYLPLRQLTVTAFSPKCFILGIWGAVGSFRARGECPSDDSFRTIAIDDRNIAQRWADTDDVDGMACTAMGL